jgi:antirestriction protein ArdC
MLVNFSLGASRTASSRPACAGTCTARSPQLRHSGDSIVAAIEAGAADFNLPWHRSGMATMLPKNAASGATYNGINILSVWSCATEKQYPTSLLATYRQGSSLEAQVRKGEKALQAVRRSMKGDNRAIFAAAANASEAVRYLHSL